MVCGEFVVKKVLCMVRCEKVGVHPLPCFLSSLTFCLGFVSSVILAPLSCISITPSTFSNLAPAPVFGREGLYMKVDRSCASGEEFCAGNQEDVCWYIVLRGDMF